MNTPRPRLSAIETYEVLSGWIASAKTQDHLDCVTNYINEVFSRHYPLDENPIHGQCIESLYAKIEAKDLNPDLLTANHQMD